MDRLWCSHDGDNTLTVLAKIGYPDIPLGSHISADDAEMLNISVDEPPPPAADHPHFNLAIEHSEAMLAAFAARTAQE